MFDETAVFDSEPAVLANIAVEMGMDKSAFTLALESAATQSHMEQSRALLTRSGGHGFW